MLLDLLLHIPIVDIEFYNFSIQNLIENVVKVEIEVI